MSQNGRKENIPILILMLFIDAAHQCRCWGKDLIDKDEDGFLRRQLDALADHIHELPNGEVGWHEVLLLVDRRDIRLLNLFADDRNAIGVLLTLKKQLEIV